MTKVGPVTNADSMYVVEYACSKDSVCKGFSCEDTSIEMGGLRIGKLVLLTRETQNMVLRIRQLQSGITFLYLLRLGMFGELLHARASTHVITSPKDFRLGWSKLKKKDQNLVLKHIKEFNKEREQHTKETKTKKTKKTKKETEKDDEEEEEEDDEEEEEEEEDEEEEEEKDKKSTKRKKNAKDSDEEEKPTKKSKSNKQKKEAKDLPSESLVQAAFPSAVWTRVFTFLPHKDIFHLSLISHLCHNSAKDAFKLIGLVLEHEPKDGTRLPSIVSEVTSITVKATKNYDFLSLFSNLSSLSVKYGSTNISLLETLQKLTKLTKLEFSQLSWGKTGSVKLKDVFDKLPLLCSLNFNGSQTLAQSISDSKDYFDAYGQFTNLTSLSLRNISYDDKLPSISKLGKLQNLTNLDMRGLRLEPDCINVFKELKNLTSLAITIRKESFDLSPLSKVTSLTMQVYAVKWDHIVLPPYLVTLKCNDTNYKPVKWPALPESLQDVYVKLQFREWKNEDHYQNLPANCRLHLCWELAHYPLLPQHIKEIVTSMKLKVKSWPRNKTLLDIMESLACKTFPILKIILDLHSCSYKKKVYEAVHHIQEKADICMVTYK